MEKMKISIITVCYNSRATLATAIESVLGQTYPDIEYIVVDGGSKDGTVELLRKYAEGKCANARIRECANENADACSDQQIRQSGDKEIRNKRIRFAKFLWISEPDEGMYDAINKGIRMATGDVIGILNADDFFEDDRVVERIANTFLTAKNTESTKIDVVYGDVRFVRECANKHAPRTSVYTMSERSFEASGAGARSGIPRWSGNARMRECANESVDGCTDQKTRQSGTKDSLERSGNHSANAESEAVIRQFSNELASLRNAKTIRYYSAKHWKPWMLQWGYMPPHPGVYIRRECFEKWGDYKLGYHIAADYELLIRFLRKEGLNMSYINFCIVGMRPGGRSTKNWRSNVLLNQEIVRGNRENRYFCCLPMLLLKYMFKIFEFIIPWLKSKSN